MDKGLPLTPMERRLIAAAGAEATGELLFHHTVLCQTCLPYRDPGDDVREWARVNGLVRLEIMAGKAMHPELERFVPLGLPFGPKPRLVLACLNAEALRTGSPVIEVEDSLRAFVRRLKLDPTGRNINTIKNQLARLSASTIRLGTMQGGRALTVTSQIVTAFDLWFSKDQQQRALWPSTVRLSDEYFQSLSTHAVPLVEEAIRALAHSAMALDIYAWLAQRLHRIAPGKPAFIPWTALQAQFGWDYERIRKFREVFEHTLRLVHTQYARARFELNEGGMELWYSPPPVAPRLIKIAPPPLVEVPPPQLVGIPPPQLVEIADFDLFEMYPHMRDVPFKPGKKLPKWLKEAKYAVLDFTEPPPGPGLPWRINIRKPTALERKSTVTWGANLRKPTVTLGRISTVTLGRKPIIRIL
jgi:hypothetical protein